MQNFLKNQAVTFLKAFSHLPFWVIYGISDFLYLIVFYLVGYRKKVVYSNLRNSFPEKTDKEINRIAKRFYSHFCDMLLETVKFNGMNTKQLNKRMKFIGLEKLEEYSKKGKSIVLWAMHYGNWEWSAYMQQFLSHQIVDIYNPIRDNKKMEDFILNMRGRYGVKLVPVNLSARTALQFDKNERPSLLFLAADQASFETSQFWTIFLNQESPFFSGPEKIARKTNLPIFFHHTRKLSRGHYEVTITELVPEPAKLSSDEIIMKYVDIVEKAIIEKPEYWLWSHRRWKHKRPEGIDLIPRKSE